MNKNFFEPIYWFNTSPGPFVPWVQKFLIAYFLACVLIFALLYIYRKRVQKTMYRKVGDSWRAFFLTNAVIGAFIQFFVYELTPFLSSRFWLIIWFLGNLVWIYFIIKRVIAIPKQKEVIEKEKEFKKYIP